MERPRSAGPLLLLLDAVALMARQHYRSPLLPENSLNSYLRDARRR